MSMHFLGKFGVLEWLYFVQCRPDKHQRDSVNLGFLFLTFGTHVIYPIIMYSYPIIMYSYPAPLGLKLGNYWNNPPIMS